MLVVLLVMLALLPAGLAQAKSQVRGTTAHTPGTSGFEGPLSPYLETWEGTISGDIEGRIEWWIDVRTWTAWPYILAEEPLPNATHYTQKVKIYDAEGLVLETLEHGTTTLANTTWRANGVVTFARKGSNFDGWEGRRVHESGDFIMGPDGPVSGMSLFRIY